MSVHPFFSRSGYALSVAFLLSLGVGGVLAFPNAGWAQQEASSSTAVEIEDEDEDESAARPRFRRPILIDTVKWQPKDGTAVTLVYSNQLHVTEPDYASLATAQPGEIVALKTCAAPKFRTDLHLLFGETRIERDNVAENYPGVYSLWLRKTTEGWNLVFNWKADVWGTMHDPEADVAEIPLDYAFQESEAKEIATLLLAEEKPKDAPRFKAELEEENGEVVFTMNWGAHHWTTRFRTA